MPEYTDEQLKEILEKQKQELRAEFEKETAGLKANRDSLLEEKRQLEEETRKQLLEKEQENIEAAKKAGEFQKALELEQAKVQREREELNAQLEQRNELILGSEKKAAVSQILSGFAKQDKLAQLTASQLVDAGFSEDGKPTLNYKNLDGEVIANSLDDWMSWAKGDADMQNHLAGSKASGTDPAAVKPSQTGQNKQDYASMTPEQKREYLDSVEVKRN